MLLLAREATGGQPPLVCVNSKYGQPVKREISAYGLFYRRGVWRTPATENAGRRRSAQALFVAARASRRASRVSWGGGVVAITSWLLQGALLFVPD